jgi:hypothetical protein
MAIWAVITRTEVVLGLVLEAQGDRLSVLDPRDKSCLAS